MSVTLEDLQPWSLSKAQVAHDCNLRFNLKYVTKARRQKIKSSAGRIGRAAHVFVEHCLNGMDYKTAYKKAAASAKLTRKEVLELATYKQPVLSFVERFSSWRDSMGVGVPDFHIEKEVAFDKEGKKSGYWDDDTFYRGVWDVGATVRRGGKDYVVIIDHKSGQPKDNLERYKDQLWTYAASAKILNPEIAGAQTAIHWFNADDPEDAIIWGPMLSSEKLSKEVVPWFWKYFEEAGDKALADLNPESGWYCKFCEFKYRCPLFDE